MKKILPYSPDCVFELANEVSPTKFGKNLPKPRLSSPSPSPYPKQMGLGSPSSLVSFKNLLEEQPPKGPITEFTLDDAPWYQEDCFDFQQTIKNMFKGCIPWIRTRHSLD